MAKQITLSRQYLRIIRRYNYDSFTNFNEAVAKTKYGKSVSPTTLTCAISKLVTGRAITEEHVATVRKLLNYDSQFDMLIQKQYGITLPAPPASKKRAALTLDERVTERLSDFSLAYRLASSRADKVLLFEGLDQVMENYAKVKTP